jgi:sugar (pentulose or hexulose) kinase
VSKADLVPLPHLDRMRLRRLIVSLDEVTSMLRDLPPAMRNDLCGCGGLSMIDAWRTIAADRLARSLDV